MGGEGGEEVSEPTQRSGNAALYQYFPQPLAIPFCHQHLGSHNVEFPLVPGNARVSRPHNFGTCRRRSRLSE